MEPPQEVIYKVILKFKDSVLHTDYSDNIFYKYRLPSTKI
jgi:hypothetical protein